MIANKLGIHKSSGQYGKSSIKLKVISVILTNCKLKYIFSSFYLAFVKKHLIFASKVNNFSSTKQECLLNGKYFILILTYVSVCVFVKRCIPFIFVIGNPQPSNPECTPFTMKN